MYCYKIKDNTLKNRCIDNYFYNDAVNNKNETSCNSITNLDLKQNCTKQFILVKAESQDYN